MKDKDVISKGPKKRDPTCYRVEQDIVIPAGTILRSAGEGKFSCPAGLVGEFSITTRPGETYSSYKRVIAP